MGALLFKSFNKETMAKDRYSCICLTCGIRNDHSRPDGLCQNGHDNWLEFRDFKHNAAVVQAACDLSGMSREELKKLFMTPSVTYIRMYHDIWDEADALEAGGYPFDWESVEVNDWEVNYRMKHMDKHVICKFCKKTAIMHPMETRLLSNGQPWLYRLCNGIWAKL